MGLYLRCWARALLAGDFPEYFFPESPLIHRVRLLEFSLLAWLQKRPPLADLPAIFRDFAPWSKKLRTALKPKFCLHFSFSCARFGFSARFFAQHLCDRRMQSLFDLVFLSLSRLSACRALSEGAWLSSDRDFWAVLWIIRLAKVTSADRTLAFSGLGASDLLLPFADVFETSRITSRTLHITPSGGNVLFRHFIARPPLRADQTHFHPSLFVKCTCLFIIVQGKVKRKRNLISIISLIAATREVRHKGQK